MSNPLRGTLSISGGAIAAQAVTLASSLALARIYTPDEFGRFAYLAGISIIIGTVSCLRMELAISLAETDASAAQACKLCFELSALTSVLALILLLGANTLVEVAHPTSLCIVAAIAGLMGAINALNQLALRSRRYHLVAARTFAQALATATVQITLGLSWGSETVLLMGTLVGLLTGVAIGSTTSEPLPRIPAGARAPILRSHRDLVVFTSPASLVNSAGLQAPLILGSKIYSETFAGNFAMTQRLLVLPVAVIGSAVSQVLLGEIGHLRRTQPDKVKTTFVKAVGLLVILGILVGSFFALLGPRLFQIVLGADFESSGAYARLMSIALAAQLVASPTAIFTTIFGRFKWQAAWDAGRLIAVSAVFLVSAGLALNATYCVALLSFALTVMYVIQLGVSWHAVRSDEKVDKTRTVLPPTPGQERRA